MAAGSEQAAGGRSARRRSRADCEALYKLAFDEGQRALADQLDELNGMRQRSVQFVAFVGAATAFLVGTGLATVDRDGVFYLLAATGSILSLSLIGLVLAVLSPWATWDYRLSSKSLVEGWIECDVPPPTDSDVYRALALVLDKMRVDNEDVLARLRILYSTLIVTGSLQLTVWAVLTWVKS